MAYEFIDEQPAPTASGRYEFVDQPAHASGPTRRYVNPNAGKSALQRGLEGAGKFVKDTALGLGQFAAEAYAAQGSPYAAYKADQMRAIADYRKMDPTLRTTAGQVGYTGAALVPAIATSFIPGVNTMTGAAAVGGAMGASQPVGQGDSRLLNTALGAGTGAAGQGVFNAVGRVAQPVKQALTPAMRRSVNTLDAASVPMDAAQRTNSAVLQRVRSHLADNPITVGGQQAFANTQKSAFNKAVLAHIGESADVADEKVMGAAYSRIGREMDGALERTSIRFSNSAKTQAAAIEASARRRLGDGGHMGSNPIKSTLDDIRRMTSENGGVLSGKDYQKIRQDLSAMERDPQLTQFAHPLRESIDNAFQQAASPADAKILQETRRQWRNMRIIENAVDSEGNISPAKLANQFGKKANRNVGVYGKGDRSILELARLAKAGKNVVPDKLPNSGTAARSLMQVAAPAAIGGLYGGYKEGDLSGVAAYAAGGAAVPWLAQKAIQNPTFANYLVNGVQNPLVRNTLMAPSKIGLGVVPPALLLSQQ
jgi:hypothetical protein